MCRRDRSIAAARRGSSLRTARRSSLVRSGLRRIQEDRITIKILCIVYISLLVATAILAISRGALAQTTPASAGTADLGDDEALVMFVVPLNSRTGFVCLDDRFIRSVPKRSHITLVTAAGRYILWCDARAQWVNLKPGRKYALVLAEPEPAPVVFPEFPADGHGSGTQVTGISYRGWDEGPEWFLDDFEVSEAMVLQLEMQEQQMEWEEVPPKKYGKRYKQMQKRLPEFALPVEFSRVFCREGQELQDVDADMRFRRKAKGWGTQLRAGTLKIDAQAVEHESDTGTLRIAVSEIQRVAFAKLAGSRPWLSIRYGDGSHPRTAYLGTKADDFNLVFMALIEASEGEAVE